MMQEMQWLSNIHYSKCALRLNHKKKHLVVTLSYLAESEAVFRNGVHILTI